MSTRSLDIDIVGYACRLPGASDVESFWQLLDEGRCAVTEIGDERWSRIAHFHPRAGVPGKGYTYAAGVIDDIWGFDPAVFCISPREAQQMDPQQRILLQVVWEALEDAGLPASRMAGRNVGVYVGASSLDQAQRRTFDPAGADSYMMTGNTLSLISNRISYVFDLHGPSLTVDTACSSSLVALDEAVQAIESGRIEMAIVGGVNILASPFPFGGFSAANMLAPDGLCRSFDADGKGYVRAEGCVAIVIGRAGAVAARPAHARIVGTDVNSDGRTVGVSLPSVDYQAALLERIYGRAAVAAEQLAFIEAHGTGTPVGDPIEAHSIGRVLGSKRTTPLPLGSVKSNLGHLEPASGLAGLLKAVLALEHDRLPASVHFRTPNPDIPFDELKLAVAAEPVALDRNGGVRFAGVNSFGFGGTNAHVIVSDPPQPARPAGNGRIVADGRPATKEPGHTLMISAQCPAALRALAKHYGARLTDGQGDGVPALASALAHRRERMPERLVVIEGSDERVPAALEAFCADRESPAVITGQAVAREAGTAFVYAGNGSQWAGMGRLAYSSNETFRSSFDRVDALFGALAGWSLREALEAADLATRLESTTVAQPLLFALQVALTEALRAEGLVPDAVTGHSVGEVAAAWACGAVSLEDGVRIIFNRSHHQEISKGAGKMAALMLPADEARAFLTGAGLAGVEIAAINSARSVTLSGPAAAIEQAANMAIEREFMCKVLDLDYPFHSAIIDPVEQPLLESLAGLAPGEESCAFVSTVTGTALPGRELGAEYWWENVRQPVRFADAIAAAAELGCRVFVEIGPRPVLGGYLNECLREVKGASAVVASLNNEDPEAVDPVRRTFARALARGARVDTERVFGTDSGACIALPTYPWQNEPFAPAVTSEALHDALAGSNDHPLLGWRIRGDDAVWHAHIDAEVVPYLADHKVDGRTVVPGAAFVEMANAAGRVWLQSELVEIRDMDIVQPLILEDGRLTEIRFEISTETSSFRIQSRERLSVDDWQTHVMGRLAAIPGDGEQPSGEVLKWNGAASMSGARVYELARRHGLDYGPAFRLADAVRQADDHTLEVRLVAARPEGDKAVYGIHPVELDACFHGLLPLYETIEGARQHLSYIPIRFGTFRLYFPGSRIAGARIRVKRASEHSLLVDFELYDEDGRLCAVLQDARFRAAALLRRPTLDRVAYRFGFETVARAGEEDESPAPDAGQAMRLFERAGGVTWPEGDEEARLLLEAASLRTAYDALAALVGESGRIDIDSLTRNDRLEGPARTLVPALLAVLEQAELANGDDGTWVLERDHELPETADILRTVIADHPAWGVACIMLNRAADRLKTLFEGGDDTGGEDSFGTATLDHFLADAPRARMHVESVANHVARIVDSWPEERPLRILQIGANGSALTRALARLVTGGKGHLAVIDVQRNIVDRLRFAFADDTAVEVLHADDGDAALKAAGRFDLAVSANGLHRLGDADDWLAKIRRRLARGALLIASETRPDAFHDVTFGLLENWFARSLDPAFPIGSLRLAEEWKSALENAGFAGVRIRSLPGDDGHASLLVACNETGAQKDREETGHSTPFIIVAGRGRDEAAFAASLKACLERRGGASVRLQPGALRRSASNGRSNGAGEGAVNGAGGLAGGWTHLAARLGDGPARIVDISRAFDVSGGSAVLERRIGNLTALLQTAGAYGPELWIVAPGGARALSGDGAPCPAQAGVWAFGRTAANEYQNSRIRLVDFAEGDSVEAWADALAACLLNPGPETELVLGERHTRALRVCRGGEAPAAGGGREAPSDVASILRSGRSGALDRMMWTTIPRRAPGRGEVEIEVAATGLNFRDVMWTLGLLPDEALEDGFAGPTLGFECSGRVVAVGEDVEGLKPGDHVIGLAPACFSSHVTVSHAAVARVPSDLDLVAAATIPVAFLTAFYALHHLARTTKGEWVLIHGGAGGVGLAALQVARWCGARVIATAGTPEKRQFLRMLGAEHVLDLRSLAFADEVMKITGEGVDVVLNSLSGEAMERSVALVRPFGRFLELGKRDYYGNTKIGLRPFRRNVSYFGIDADQLLSRQPELADRLFTELAGLFAEGTFWPLPYRRFDSRDVVDAFRLMQQAGHIGKIVVTPERPERLYAAIEPGAFQAAGDGAHVIVGGLGGFGLATAKWLAEKGAGTLVLASRRGEVSGEARSTIDGLRERGVGVRIETCDVADKKALDALLAAVRAEMPIRGIVHAAMVLDDAAIENLDSGKIDRVLAPKVAGAANLDALTRDDSLDYFVMYSSVTALFGNVGQAAYVAANGFLEGLARRRREEGLPALAVGWGAITDVGYLARNREAGEVIARRAGVAEFRAEHALELLEELLARDDGAPGAAALTVAPMNWAMAARSLPLLSGPGYRLLAREGAAGSLGDDGQGIDLAAEIAGLDDAEASALVTRLLVEEISAILRISPEQIKTNRPLTEVGMDSLMGMELRMAAQQKLGVDIPLVSISDGLTIDEIAAKLLARVGREGTGASGAHVDLAQRHVADAAVNERTPEEVETVRKRIEERQSQLERLL